MSKAMLHHDISERVDGVSGQADEFQYFTESESGLRAR